MTAAEIDTIYIEFHNSLRSFILSRVSDAQAAEDILQEVFIRIHSNLQGLRDQSKLRSWIYQISRNAIIDYYRREVITEELPEALPAWEDVTPDASEELATTLGAFLRCLPEKYEEALLMTEYQGLTQKDMAERLGLSLSGAKSRVQRAREKLKEALLDCCHFEMDNRGGILTYTPRCEACADRDYPPGGTGDAANPDNPNCSTIERGPIKHE
jgi:RNA polymerase sigma-70 factor, ECF subfamily